MTKRKCKCPPGSPFHWQDVDRPSIFMDAKLRNALNNSQKQTAYLEREKANGRDPSNVAGLSRETRVQRVISLRQFTVYSHAGKVL